MDSATATQTQLLTRIVLTTTDVVRERTFDIGNRLYQTVVHHAHVKQVNATERDLRSTLIPMFRAQIEQIAKKVGGLQASDATTAALMIGLVFDQEKATEELISTTLPVLAYRMAEVSYNELRRLGATLKKRERSVRILQKASTATEWLENQGSLDELFEDMPQFIPGSMPYRIATELPVEMKRMIAAKLRESYAQPYWTDISQTTAGAAERVLDEGIRDGWSIRRMAQGMRESLGGDQYARTRSYNIARTESGNALNGARKGTIEQLQNDLGDQLPMQQVWLSVLGDTTRDDHANLNNVPANAEGMWTLGGYVTPYPGHFSLPAGERCNCLCTLFTELGMDREEAGRLIDQQYERTE